MKLRYLLLWVLMICGVLLYRTDVAPVTVLYLVNGIEVARFECPHRKLSTCLTEHEADVQTVGARAIDGDVLTVIIGNEVLIGSRVLGPLNEE